MQISWHLFVLICLGLLVMNVQSDDDGPLRVAYEWKEMDFNYLNTDERLVAIQNETFIPKNVIPFGMEVYRDRVFITLPRWKKGVPASLAYFNMTETNTTNPILKPYPSWQAHNLLNETNPELVSPFRIRADACGRLWVLDSRISGVLESTQLYGPAQLLVYEMHSDNLLRRYIFPANQMKERSFFASLAVEDTSCENTYVYAGDLGNPGLVVYSWSSGVSWRVQHNFFHPDPLAGNFNINNITFQWDDGVYGLALSREISGNTSLYFHPLSSYMEFVVDTSILHNATKATSPGIYHEFKTLGSRGRHGQAGASFLDKKTDVLFFTLPNSNAVACWQTMEPAYTFKPESIVQRNAITLGFPSDVVVDASDSLWILSNRLHAFMYSKLDANDFNFRILTGNVKNIIEATTCGPQTVAVTDIIPRIPVIVKSGSNILGVNSLILPVLSIYMLIFIFI